MIGIMKRLCKGRRKAVGIHAPMGYVLYEQYREALQAAQIAANELKAYRKKLIARRRESDDRYREAVDLHRSAMAATDANPTLRELMREGE